MNSLNLTSRSLLVVAAASITLPLSQPVHAVETPASEDLLRQVQELKATVARQQKQIDALVTHIESSREATPQDSGEAVAARGPGTARQEEVTTARPASASTASERGLHWEGYGVINYTRSDFYTNAQDATPEQRASTDLERIVISPTFNLGNGYKFVSEIEFEHGGTGSTVEYEAEEAGEFEIELEKGGEVVLEQAFLQIDSTSLMNWRIGEIVVPFGMVNTHHQPSQYFTIERSLAETSLIPSVWHETGVELFGSLGQARYQMQVVTALDSAGFSGYGFVSGGMQSKLEFRNANALAFVGRIDYSLMPGVLIGGALYHGDSAKNRARDDMDVNANVTLAEFHGRYERGPLTVRGQYMVGTIENSDLVTRANLTSFNAGVLGISKTPVGSRAEAYFIEAGYDLFSFFNKGLGRLDAFARYESFDTHADTEVTITRLPRYERTATTYGLNYKPRPGVVLKTEYSHRTHAGTVGNKQDYYGLGLGVEF